MSKFFVFRSNLLGYSETFIKAQVLSHRRWQPIVLGLRAVQGLSLDGLDIRFLLPQSPWLLRKVWSRGHKYAGAVPPGTIRRLRRENAKLLHAHFGRDGVVAAPIARALGVPLLVTLHGYDINIHREWWEAGRGGHRMRDFPERLLKLAREPSVHFIAVSEAIRARAVAFGIPEKKVTVRYIGVDTERFAPAGRLLAEREPRVLFIGRLVEKKGCAYLVEAMAEVSRSVPGARLIVIGDGPQRAELEDMAQRLDVHATFRGVQPAAEVKRELDLARVFCLPSVRATNGDAEGLPISILEAQASGVPVVTSAQGGRTEGIRNELTGFSFAERNTETLTVQLITLLSEDDLAARMGRAARDFAAEVFDIRRCTEALESTMNAIANLDTSEWIMPGRSARLWQSSKVRPIEESIRDSSR